jgi:hypothetical protein
VNEVLRRGDLSQTPFARVLSEIWRNELSGTLTVRGRAGPKSLSFDGGALVIDRESLPEKDFLKALLTAGEADLISLARLEEFAQKQGLPAVRALLEIPLLGPRRVWELLEAFVREEAYPLFDETAGEFEFESRPARTGAAYVRGISLPGLILEGVRRMANFGVIRGLLPAETESIQSVPPGSLEIPELAPHERYLLEVLGPSQTLADLYDSSDLGKRETQRVLFVFLCLGLAGTRPPKPKTGRIAVEMSLADMDKLFGLFNAKCSAIFKYISKEIGPVAQSVIRNALEDVRGRLDPAFQGFELKADGRIELKSFLKTSMNVIGEESRRGFLRSMDEILVAEVLAVKRTLGSGHESALVKSLERIGDLP